MTVSTSWTASLAAPDEAATKPLLVPGETCWRIEHADHASVLVDNQSYFAAARRAIESAQHSILLLGWCFDPRTVLEPTGATLREQRDYSLGRLLIRLGDERPNLDIRIIVWDMALPIALPRSLYPHRAKSWFHGTRVHFRLAEAPAGACLHEKILVVDDRIAFCSGGDFLPNRWDSTDHRDHEPRRRLPTGSYAPPRHEVTMVVDGAAASALGDVVRQRWQDETKREVATPPSAPRPQVWPLDTGPHFRNVGTGIARTRCGARQARPAREALALHLRTIAAARRYLYLENQYFASWEIAIALAARLAEPNGPEIVLVCARQAPSFFDRLVMDVARNDLLKRLQAADVHGRFRAYSPLTEEGQPIIVHSKVTIADDRLLRIGSANLNNRSGGLDTECDLALDADMTDHPEMNRETIHRIRNELLGHFLGVSGDRVAAGVDDHGNLIRGIEALDPEGRRLAPLRPERNGWIGRLIARYEFGDPHDLSDRFRPWRRRTARREPLESLGQR